MPGTSTTSLPESALSDELIGNRDGTSVRQPVRDLGGQLLGQGPISEAFATLRLQVSSSGVLVADWATLQAMAGSQDRSGAEVLDGDEGTHAQATATGYDGDPVPNSGRFSWNAAWGRWARIGDTFFGSLGSAASSDAGDFATAGQGGLADTALQPAALDTHKSAADQHPIDGVAGLQAALADKATSDQGQKADTALQQANLDAHKTSNDQHTISGVVGLSAALEGKASSAQGQKADTALQPLALAEHGVDPDQHPMTGVSGLVQALGQKADLQEGRVPTSQLPGYVDDVIEVGDFAALPATGEQGKIYITLDTEVTYRWAGSGYREISASLAIGETPDTAYRGDRGAQAHAHISKEDNPHNTTKEQVGLGNVPNTAPADLPLSTAATDALALKANTDEVATPEQGTKADNALPAAVAAPLLSSVVPTAEGGFVFIDLEGNALFQMDRAGVRMAAARIGATFMQGSIYPFALEDIEGGVNAAVTDQGDLLARSLNLPNGIAIEALVDPTWRMVHADQEGGIGFGIRHDGGVGLKNLGDVLDGQAQEIGHVWAEPWQGSDLSLSWTSDLDAGKAVEYRVVGASSWEAAVADRSRPFPEIADTFIHTALLDGLSPNAVYEVRWPGASKFERIKTLPRADVTLGFISDYHNGTAPFRLLGDAARQRGVDLVVGVGDLVGQDGEISPAAAALWEQFLEILGERYRTSSGALIPVAMMVGNHEAHLPGVTTNALSGGVGVLGMIDDIFSCGFDMEQGTYRAPGCVSLALGREVLIIMIDTDHVTPLMDQIPWAIEQLARADDFRHVVVAGHCPAFLVADNYDFRRDSQSRTLIAHLWPAMQAHADKIRFYVAGHEHVLSVTDKLAIDYDPNQSLQANETRWNTDPVNGVRAIGAGPCGGGRQTFSAAKAGETGLDGSPMLIAALGYDSGPDTVDVFGTGITNAAAETWHMWVCDFTSAGWSATAVNQLNLPFYTITEAL